VKAVSRLELLKLNLYSDPTCDRLVRAIAHRYELKPEQVLAGNGSDELLSFAFRAFCGEGKGVAFPDVSYGFYKVWAAFYGVEAKVVPLKADFTIDADDYMDYSGTILLANPNALTGVELPAAQIQRLLEADRDRVVIVDEAYVDFGGESCVPLCAGMTICWWSRPSQRAGTLRRTAGLCAGGPGSDCGSEPGEIQL